MFISSGHSRCYAEILVGAMQATPNVGVLKRDAINFVSVFRDGSQKKSLSGYFLARQGKLLLKLAD